MADLKTWASEQGIAIFRLKIVATFADGEGWRGLIVLGGCHGGPTVIHHCHAPKSWRVPW